MASIPAEQPPRLPGQSSEDTPFSIAFRKAAEAEETAKKQKASKVSAKKEKAQKSILGKLAKYEASLKPEERMVLEQEIEQALSSEDGLVPEGAQQKIRAALEKSKNRPIKQEEITRNHPDYIPPSPAFTPDPHFNPEKVVSSANDASHLADRAYIPGDALKVDGNPNREVEESRREIHAARGQLIATLDQYEKTTDPDERLQLERKAREMLHQMRGSLTEDIEEKVRTALHENPNRNVHPVELPREISEDKTIAGVDEFADILSEGMQDLPPPPVKEEPPPLDEAAETEKFLKGMPEFLRTPLSPPQNSGPFFRDLIPDRENAEGTVLSSADGEIPPLEMKQKAEQSRSLLRSLIERATATNAAKKLASVAEGVSEKYEKYSKYLAERDTKLTKALNFLNVIGEGAVKNAYKLGAGVVSDAGAVGRGLKMAGQNPTEAIRSVKSFVERTRSYVAHLSERSKELDDNLQKKGLFRTLATDYGNLPSQRKMYIGLALSGSVMLAGAFSSVSLAPYLLMLGQRSLAATDVRYKLQARFDAKLTKPTGSASDPKAAEYNTEKWRNERWARNLSYAYLAASSIGIIGGTIGIAEHENWLGSMLGHSPNPDHALAGGGGVAGSSEAAPQVTSEVQASPGTSQVTEHVNTPQAATTTSAETAQASPSSQMDQAQPSEVNTEVPPASKASPTNFETTPAPENNVETSAYTTPPTSTEQAGETSFQGPDASVVVNAKGIEWTLKHEMLTQLKAKNIDVNSLPEDSDLRELLSASTPQELEGAVRKIAIDNHLLDEATNHSNSIRGGTSISFDGHGKLVLDGHGKEPVLYSESRPLQTETQVIHNEVQPGHTVTPLEKPLQAPSPIENPPLADQSGFEGMTPEYLKSIKPAPDLRYSIPHSDESLVTGHAENAPQTINNPVVEPSLPPLSSKPIDVAELSRPQDIPQAAETLPLVDEGFIKPPPGFEQPSVLGGEVIKNAFGIPVSLTEPHIYGDNSSHLFAYGGSVSERMTKIGEYLKAHPRSLVYGPDTNGDHRIPFALGPDGNIIVAGTPARKSFFERLFSNDPWEQAVDPGEFRKMEA